MRPVSGHNISWAWLHAMDALLEDGGKSLNLVVEIENPLQESEAMRWAFDHFVTALPGDKVPYVSTVANTIFPSALYIPRLGAQAYAHLHEMHTLGRIVGRQVDAATYFDRLVAWPHPSGEPFDQVDFIIDRLKKQMLVRNPKSSAYELGISTVGEDNGGFQDKQISGIRTVEEGNYEDESSDYNLRIQYPGRDKNPMSFPCLSHISLTLHKKRLHMTALYRNQHFISRAYGNYLGLGRLLGCICHESGCEPGTLTCVATHADAEIHGQRGLGKQSIEALVEGCRSALEIAEGVTC